jgi:hypothetical protein
VNTIKNLYLDEDSGHRNFFYQIMGVILMKKKENFTLESTPKEYDGTLMRKSSFMLNKMHMITRGMKSVKRST